MTVMFRKSPALALRTNFIIYLSIILLHYSLDFDNYNKNTILPVSQNFSDERKGLSFFWGNIKSLLTIKCVRCSEII